MTTKQLIIDLQYFGNIKYYLNLFKYTHAIFEQYNNYSKRDFLNRCIIAGANGPISLSVPLQKGRSQRTIVKDVLIANEENWQNRHWKSILSSYNGSPWFSFYTDSLSQLYSTPFRFLLDWNMACLEWSLENINKEFSFELSKEYKASYAEAGTDLRKMTGDNKIGAADGVIRYNQVFADRTGFIPDLSILDLLFCEGPARTLSLLQPAGV